MAYFFGLRLDARSTPQPLMSALPKRLAWRPCTMDAGCNAARSPIIPENFVRYCRLPLSLLCLAICCWFSGCQRDEEIVHYTVPRIEPTRVEPAKETVRLLGAIVPHND